VHAPFFTARMCRCSVRLRSKHPRLLCAGRADLQGEEDRVNNRRVDVGSSEEEDTQDYISPYAACGPGLVVLASAYIPGAGLPVRPSLVYITRPAHLRHRGRLPAPIRRRRTVHALVERLRHGPAVWITPCCALGSSRCGPPSPGLMCGRGGTASGSSWAGRWRARRPCRRGRARERPVLQAARGLSLRPSPSAR
jgi:hypothetical protein